MARFKNYNPSYHDIFLYDLVSNPYDATNGSTHRPVAINSNNPFFGKFNFTCITNDFRRLATSQIGNAYSE